MAALASGLKRMAAPRGCIFRPRAVAESEFQMISDYEGGRLLCCDPWAWKDVDLGGIAHCRLGCVIFDVNLGGLAHLSLGCAQSAQDMLCILWGAAIGGGPVLVRRLYPSRGHIPADRASDRLCYRGCRGCLTAEASGKGLCAQVRGPLPGGDAPPLASEGLTPELIPWGAARLDRQSSSGEHAGFAGAELLPAERRRR